MIDKIIKIIRIRILFENDINFIYLHRIKVNLTTKIMLEEKNDNLQNNAEGNEQINHETVLTIDETSSNNAKSALDTIEKENAEENEENGTVKQEVPEKEYESLSPAELVNELNDLLSNYKITALKNQVEEIKKDGQRQAKDLGIKFYDTPIGKEVDRIETTILAGELETIKRGLRIKI